MAMAQKSGFTSMDEYFAAAPADARRILKKIRTIVRSVAPQAQETLSYQIPAFRLGRVFFYFAAFKKHIGIYPPVKGSAALDKALQAYRGEKGNLKFPLDQPMPYGLIKRVVVALKRQYAQ
jgi:uncharacterized protein YdhG (YjbR/CyaY superfamily)